MNKQFKYKAITIHSAYYNSTVERNLTELGTDGWELVHAHRNNDELKCILKKEIILSVPKTYNKE